MQEENSLELEDLVEKRKMTALIHAVQQSNDDATSRRLRERAQFKTRFFEMINQGGFLSAIISLEKSGRVFSEKEKREAFFLAIAYQGKEDCTAFIGLMISKKYVSINAVSQDGMTPLHFAVMCGNLRAMAYLVNHEAKLDAKTPDGVTPQGLALAMGNQPFADYLALAHHAAEIRSSSFLTRDKHKENFQTYYKTVDSQEIRNHFEYVINTYFNGGPLKDSPTRAKPEPTPTTTLNTRMEI